MGLLEQGLAAGAKALGLPDFSKRKIKPPAGTPDFPNGLIVREVINGRTLNVGEGNHGFQLNGVYKPKVPFTFGGKQQIVRDYYPGNSEPVVQVLGPRENNTKISGCFKTTMIKGGSSRNSESLKSSAEEFQQQVDAVRLRGHLLKIELGEWRRYGYLEECNFKLNRLTDIEYEIDFIIIGFNPPRDCKMIADPSDDIIAPNKKVLADANAALGAARAYPSEMPRTLGELLNDAISDVAGVINTVTGFVDGIINDVESIQKSATRAVGLIKNARATISRTMRRIGAIQQNVATLGAGISGASFKAAAQIKNQSHLNQTVAGMAGINASLQSLQSRFAAMSASTPMRRHLVRNGDSLQTIAMKYYNSSENWKKIYDHNKLANTNLRIGSVLEIPKA